MGGSFLGLPIYVYIIGSISYRFVAEIIPWVVIGPFIGPMINKKAKKKLMIGLNILAGIVMMQYFYASISVLMTTSNIGMAVLPSITGRKSGKGNSENNVDRCGTTVL